MPRHDLIYHIHFIIIFVVTCLFTLYFQIQSYLFGLIQVQLFNWCRFGKTSLVVVIVYNKPLKLYFQHF